ncbi:MAG: hypothetical protein IPK03_05965 [Bacteroidetes bacterium]|nr:hypothetical protein [Bacteroidota bacterium]
MFKYILKRIIYFVPTLIIIALCTFLLSKMAPGDPVKSALGNQDKGGEAGQASEKMAGERSYYEMAEKMGLHLPTFYVSLTNAATPDSMYKIIKKPHRGFGAHDCQLWKLARDSELLCSNRCIAIFHL